MKSTKTITKEQLQILHLPGGNIIIGPGTVPTSTASVPTTSIKDMIKEFRRASKLGLFEQAT